MYEYAMLLVYKDGQRETIFPHTDHILNAVKAGYGHAKVEGRELAHAPMFLSYRHVAIEQVAA